MKNRLFSYRNLILANYKSGLAVSVISVPLSISLAVASGATPLQGIITAIFAAIFAALFGGSQFNIVGPTGALSGLILAFAIGYGYEYIPFIAIVTGVIIAMVWALRLTKYITLIPSTALHGFIIGVAIIISVNQFNGALGLVGLPIHESLFANFLETIAHVGQANRAAVSVFAIAFILLQIIKKYLPKVPGIIPVSILGIATGYLVNQGIIPLHIITLSDNFPDLAFHLIEPVQRGVLFGNFRANIGLYTDIGIASLTVAIIAILETIISAKIADRMTKTKFHEQKEILGLSLANIASGLAGGIPATAALVRTSLNIKSGATSWMSAAISSVCIILISWIFFDYFKYIPIPVISAILISIAVGMLDFKALKKVHYYDKFSLYVIVLVAGITFVWDPIYGIIVGTSIGLLAYLYNTSQGHLFATVFRGQEYLGKMHFDDYILQQLDGDVVVCKFGGDISFLNINAEIKHIAKINKKVQLIISFSDISYIDIDGIEVFEEIIEIIASKDCTVCFAGVHDRLQSILSKTHYFQQLSQQGKVFPSTSAALRGMGVK